MSLSLSRTLQLVVFLLVASAFTNIYLTQPVLPVLQQEFNASAVEVSWSISAVILGIALANIPFGMVIDRWPIRPILLAGGGMVAVSGLLAAYVDSFSLHVVGRFFQGFFLPALTTGVAAYLGRVLPLERLNVIMGSYVAATVLGGLGGRLLGGWIHPPLHWRYAFISSAVLTLLAVAVAWFLLPREPATSHSMHRRKIRLLDFILNGPLLRLLLSGSGAFFVFSSLFNYLPFRLSAAPFNLSTNAITAVYLVYFMGVFIGPFSGKLANRWGSGRTLMAGAAITFFAVLLSSASSLSGIVFSLLVLCAGFFTVHAASVGALNRRLVNGHGRANALYVLFYYFGGWLGMNVSGLAYEAWGWHGVMVACTGTLLLPLLAGWKEHFESDAVNAGRQV